MFPKHPKENRDDQRVRQRLDTCLIYLVGWLPKPCGSREIPYTLAGSIGGYLTGLGVSLVRVVSHLILLPYVAVSRRVACNELYISLTVSHESQTSGHQRFVNITQSSRFVSFMDLITQGPYSKYRSCKKAFSTRYHTFGPPKPNQTF